MTHQEWVSDLWVLRESRRHGVGRKLLARGESEIAARGHETCRLRVVKSNTVAVQFYLGQGWQVAREFAHEKYNRNDWSKGMNRAFLRLSSEDPFHSLCELSGGTVVLSDTRLLQEMLKRFVAMLRERYIVEFPRPAKATAGAHTEDVKIARSNDFIRPAGISVPLPDPAVLADPTTVSSGPAPTPDMGTRVPMKTPQ
jgi:hypothetical protein